MRNLTIKREKRFVASLGKTKIYIEDPENGTLKIGGVLCRKLGELKNGEEKTFSIGTGETKVFALVDKISRNYSNDCYTISAGEEDVSLSGRHVFSLGTGNPFRFDSVTDPTTLANRKRGNRLGAVVLIFAWLVGLVSGFAGGRTAVRNNTKPKDFTVDEMTITLTGAFKETEVEGFAAAYGTHEVAVFVVKEPFALAEGFGDLSLEEYGALVIQSNAAAAGAQLHTEEEPFWFDYTYTPPQQEETFYYYSTVFKSEESFWAVQFAVPEGKAETYAPQFAQWIDSVTFE